MGMRKRDPMKAVISAVNDERFAYIISMGNMCFKMASRQGRRVKQLSRDTATSFHHTCQGVVALTKYLLIYCKYDMFASGSLPRIFWRKKSVNYVMLQERLIS